MGASDEMTSICVNPDKARSALPDHQVVAVHHLGAAAEAEDEENVGGRAALDLIGLLGGPPRRRPARG
jgi:hypothetical protein